jgi:actin-like ATPase involved in cell morphogenesis
VGYRLGIDLGTTYTSAAVYTAGWPTMVGLGNRAMQVPSVLFLKPDGEFLVGEAAERRGAAEPERLTREFKRRLGDQVPILVAGSPQSPQALQARLLSWVVAQVTERQGSAPDHITLTYPANWGPYKRELFDQTIAMADLIGVDTCTEPEGAATLYAARNVMAEGDCVAVYDLGGGTFDAAVLRKTSAGFDLLGRPEGIEHLGGIDFDEAVFHHVIDSLGDAVTALPESPELEAGLIRLRRDCVEAKEALSADTDTVIAVTLPGLSTSVRLVRDELDAMLGPTISATIGTLRRAIRSANIEPANLTAIVLTGGSSRIPLVSQQITQAFGRPLAIDTHPKHDVALGAAMHGLQLSPSSPAQGKPPAVNQPRQEDARPEVANGEPPTGPSALPSSAGESAARPRATTLRKALMLGFVALLTVGAVLVGLAKWLQLPGGGNSTTPAWPNSTILFTGSATVGGHTVIHLYALDMDDAKRARATLLTTPSGAGQGPQPLAPRFSVDRTQFVYLLGMPTPGGGPPWGVPRLRAFNGDDSRLFNSTSPCKTTYRPAFAPDDQRIAVVCPPSDSSEGQGLYTVDTHGNDAKPLDRLATGVPVWTQTNLIIYRRVDSDYLWSIDLNDPAPTPVQFTDGAGIDSSPTWSAEHGLLFIRTTGDVNTYWVQPASGPAYPIGTIPGTSPSSSPDGSRFAYTTGDAIWTVGFDSKYPRKVPGTSSLGVVRSPDWGPH